MNLKVGLSITSLLAVVVSIVFYVYNKPHKDIGSTATDHSISSKKLVAFYIKDEDIANNKFLGKVIEVNGTILLIHHSNATEVVIELEGTQERVVICVLSRKQAAEKTRYKKGAIITIKGICIGMLQDVNMKDCIIINE